MVSIFNIILHGHAKKLKSLIACSQNCYYCIKNKFTVQQTNEPIHLHPEMLILLSEGLLEPDIGIAKIYLIRRAKLHLLLHPLTYPHYVPKTPNRRGINFATMTSEPKHASALPQAAHNTRKKFKPFFREPPQMPITPISPR